MFQRLRQRNPGRSIPGLLFYSLAWNICMALCVLVYRLRVWGRRNIPATGPLLVISNHQSFLDPVLNGMAMTGRDLSFLARWTLFGPPGFGKLIEWLNAVPLKQGEPDRAAIRTALEQLEVGKAILIYPEGGRTDDGRMQEFKRGVWVLLARAKCPVLPMAIEGAYNAWPRGRKLPRVFGQRIWVMVGEPIEPGRLLAMGDDAGLEFLRQRIESMRLELARRMEHAGFRPGSLPLACPEGV